MDASPRRLTDRAQAAGDPPAGARVVDVSPCPPGHNTPIPLERSAPGSFKRLLGGVPFTMAGRGAVGVAVVLGPALSNRPALRAPQPPGGPGATPHGVRRALAPGRPVAPWRLFSSRRLGLMVPGPRTRRQRRGTART